MPTTETGLPLPRWSDRAFLAALLGVVLVVRLAVARSHEAAGLDEALYFSYGDSWLRTGTYSGIQWPITYPLTLALLARVTGARAAVDVLFVLIGALTVLPMFFAVRRLRGSAAARWTAAIAGLVPSTSAVIAKSGTHSLYLPLLATAFWACVRALDSPRARDHALLGGLLGFAYVTRTDGIVYLGLVGASLLLLPRSEPMPKRLRRAAVVGLASLLFVVPNVLHVRHYTGKAQVTSALGPILEAPVAEDMAQDDEFRQRTQAFREGRATATERVLHDPGYFATRMAYNARHVLRVLGDMHGLTIPLLLLAGIGVLGLLSGGGRTGFLVLVWCLPPAAFVTLHVEARYLSPTILFACVLAGEGAAVLASALRERGWSAWVPALAAATAASLLVMSAMTILSLRRIEERGIEPKAEAIRRLAGPRLAQTFILDAHLRMAVDGPRGASKSAPMTEAHSAAFYVFDQDDRWNAQARILDRARAQGGLLTEAARDGKLVLYERRSVP